MILPRLEMPKGHRLLYCRMHDALGNLLALSETPLLQAYQLTFESLSLPEKNNKIMFSPDRYFSDFSDTQPQPQRHCLKYHVVIWNRNEHRIFSSKKLDLFLKLNWKK